MLKIQQVSKSTDDASLSLIAQVELACKLEVGRGLEMDAGDDYHSVHIGGKNVLGMYGRFLV